jgi:TetR/AcrR family tetracycline transcriptional repressor
MAKRIASESLSREVVVERALALADAEGLDAVTIRRLAQDLGVTPMALYWHVQNKDELLDAMGDRLFAEMTYDVGADARWEEQLRAVVRALVEALRAHPTCIELAYRRIFASPEGQQIAEHTLGLLRRAGFSRRRTADIATHALQTAVILVSGEPGAEPGSTAEDVAARLDEKRKGLEQLPIDQFPYIREMADEMLHCDDVDEYYEFNIDLFVVGARAMLADPAAVPPARPRARAAGRQRAQSSA